MKYLFRFILGVLILAVVCTSCSHRHDVVSNAMFQKRKYRKGFHIDRLGRQQHVLAQNDLPERNPAGDDFGRKTGADDPEGTKDIGEPGFENETAIIGPEHKNTGDQPKLLRAGRQQQDTFEKINPIRKFSKRSRGDTKRESKEPDPSLPGILSIAFGGANLLIFMWVPLLGVVLGILAIIFGVKALRIDDETGKSLAIIGIVFGAISLFVALLISFYVIVLLLILGF